jgi:hypothetical protein
MIAKRVFLVPKLGNFLKHPGTSENVPELSKTPGELSKNTRNFPECPGNFPKHPWNFRTPGELPQNTRVGGGWWVGGWVPQHLGKVLREWVGLPRGTCDTCQSLIGRRRIYAYVACHVVKIDTCHHLIGPRGTHCHVSNLAKKCHFSAVLEKGSKPTSYYNPY